ncbi:spindle and kinetochore-associated protein 2 [Betta splendens]|uniref:Protein FAM33A n=1 Tax=Betta splendens TaxID=158456 RepID=A0A9W2X8D7_BETSP|nr:spindle and kinetochore-associated protein 2 [Betta splendens]
MEITVDKLEAMFQKSEADLDYLEKRLKLHSVNSKTKNGVSAEETTVMILENLISIRAKHAALSSQVKEIIAAEKQSMNYIRKHIGSAMDLMHHVQQASAVEVPLATGASVKQQSLRVTPNQL